MYNFESNMADLNIVIINGPNLNLLGTRQPEIYGTQSFENYYSKLKSKYPEITFSYFQSNIEGELISHLQKVGFENNSIILNAGGYTHTSVAIADAVAAISAEVIEVHISQPASREIERHTSLLSRYSNGSISGLGLYSYEAAALYFNNRHQS
jgi:3-dehydroquinate dehydratase-2|tara:strand:- start:162 stop:620 length:459 start_codon:yes stop_codon:yes gene_type:complete